MYKEQVKGDIIVGSAKEHGCGVQARRTGPHRTGCGRMEVSQARGGACADPEMTRASECL